MKKMLLAIGSMILTGCMGMPETVTPVQGFELQKYLGNWYEIARLDHSFERGLDQVTAKYVLREDGGVTVVNRGFSAEADKWKQAEGKAYFVDKDSEGYLKVSFFGPFYSSYVVFELDSENYQYAFISGHNTHYLWLLARTPVVDSSVIDKFVALARERGFATDQLIFVKH